MGGPILKDPLPPRQYAAQVLGKAATQEQLDELFSLHAAAHPVVEHGHILNPKAEPYDVTKLKPEQPELVRCCTVAILSSNPAAPTSRARTLVTAQAVCNPGDQWNRRLGVTIAFGRALKKLRAEVRG